MSKLQDADRPNIYLLVIPESARSGAPVEGDRWVLEGPFFQLEDANNHGREYGRPFFLTTRKAVEQLRDDLNRLLTP